MNEEVTCYYVQPNKYMTEFTLKELKDLLDENELDLSARGLTVVPKALPQLGRATEVDLRSNKIVTLPNEICTMTRLVRLDCEARKSAKKNTESYNDTKTVKKSSYLVKMFSFTFRWTLFLMMCLVLSSTVAILINCTQGGTDIARIKPLCSDLSKLSQFEKPSDHFLSNIRSSYSKIFVGYSSRIVSTVNIITNQWSKFYEDFAKSDIGRTINKYFYQVHTIFVNIILQLTRYAERLRTSIYHWWVRDGEKQLGEVVENLRIVGGVLYEMGKDVFYFIIGDANKELGLALDKTDLNYYEDLFINKLKRNPTDVELFDLAQSDSEHSRHWFFRGQLIVDGNERKDSLMTTIRETQDNSNNNNLIAFCDNSSAIRGFPSVKQLLPIDPSVSSPMCLMSKPRHLIYSAETHNFPTAVCPYQWQTGRVILSEGIKYFDIPYNSGAHEIAGVAGYAFGNLHLENYHMPWEDGNDKYPLGFSHPRQIAIEASNGASDYGNKFGEPVLCGFARSFGQRLPNGERSEYVKPIMLSGGIGAIGEYVLPHILPYYFLAFFLIFNILAHVISIWILVQFKEEMQKWDRSYIEWYEHVLKWENRILSYPFMIKELEEMENDACLVDPILVEKMFAVSKREKCKVSLVGHVTNEQRVTLKNFPDSLNITRHPVDFDTKVLGNRGKKVFHLSTVPLVHRTLQLPANLTTRLALDMVLRLPSVASKRYLTCKVDRSVTGLIARQQCVGPLHTPLADVAVVALSYFDKLR
uniref:FGAR-AT_linker domain-containing protein n=1 Tax=Heterorhabditis bacteriophora TaxID=37862 RepID=A0A1I7XAG5_HETBA